MKILAHRGYSAKYPENTMIAFLEAAKLNIWGVEFDVHLTKDNQLVVIHDESINRTSTGKGFVKDMTARRSCEHSIMAYGLLQNLRVKKYLHWRKY